MPRITNPVKKIFIEKNITILKLIYVHVENNGIISTVNRAYLQTENKYNVTLFMEGRYQNAVHAFTLSIIGTKSSVGSTLLPTENSKLFLFILNMLQRNGAVNDSGKWIAKHQIQIQIGLHMIFWQIGATCL